MLSCFFCDMVFACHLGDCINPAIALRIESICHGQSEIYHETLQGVWCRKCHSGSFVWSQHNYNMLQVDNVNPGSITLAINWWVPPRSSGQWLQKTLPPHWLLQLGVLQNPGWTTLLDAASTIHPTGFIPCRFTNMMGQRLGELLPHVCQIYQRCLCGPNELDPYLISHHFLWCFTEVSVWNKQQPYGSVKGDAFIFTEVACFPFSFIIYFCFVWPLAFGSWLLTYRFNASLNYIVMLNHLIQSSLNEII